MSDSNGGGGNSSSSAGATSTTTPSGGNGGGGKAQASGGRGNTSKLLTHQMSSGSLTGVRSTRDRDITNLVPSGTDISSPPLHPFSLENRGYNKMAYQFTAEKRQHSCRELIILMKRVCKTPLTPFPAK